MPWRKARKYIKDDVRYKGFSDNDHVSTSFSLNTINMYTMKIHVLYIYTTIYDACEFLFN